MLMLSGFSWCEVPSADNSVPHQSCRNVPFTYERRPAVRTLCEAEGNTYLIPDNFDMSLLQSEIGSLNVIGGAARSDPVTPLPSRSTLLTVHLERFNTEASWPRFPIDRFFINVKAHLETLSLVNVKLLKLVSWDFKDFERLKTLRLVQVQVEVISATIFESLTSESGSPVLAHVEIRDGRVSSLDWAFLKPIASSLITLCPVIWTWCTSDKNFFETLYPGH
ncbi:hypothetical protein BV898_10096 [Hypsibius exemplaris]|uniref:Uncharacterized protein n=1 Tax=Hypsibius exemplaris TaxID=2072580 RepID=A0A1W0WKQ9_HYPEX|nr:hypothetical protein BV898_10096 [Hypsibius exemplaris]